MSRKQKRVFWPILALIVLSFASVGFVSARIAKLASATVESAPGVPQPIGGNAIVSPEQSRDDVQGLVIALRPNGFSPADIELTDGRYFFIVQNRCGIRDLTFRLDREAGERLHEVHDRKPQWKKEFDLHPGTYVLSVVDHPKWRCLIKVKPQ